MIETNPKSIFGKVPYFREQAGIYNTTNYISRGLWLLSPELVPMGLPKGIVEKLGIEKRMRVSKNWLERARDQLKEIM